MRNNSLENQKFEPQLQEILTTLKARLEFLFSNMQKMNHENINHENLNSIYSQAVVKILLEAFTNLQILTQQGFNILLPNKYGKSAITRLTEITCNEMKIERDKLSVLYSTFRTAGDKIILPPFPEDLILASPPPPPPQRPTDHRNHVTQTREPHRDNPRNEAAASIPKSNNPRIPIGNRPPQLPAREEAPAYTYPERENKRLTIGIRPPQQEQFNSAGIPNYDYGYNDRSTEGEADVPAPNISGYAARERKRKTVADENAKKGCCIIS